MSRIPIRRVRWRSAWRIVPSRFPPVGLWDRIATPAEFESLAEIEALTNPRLRQQLGVLAITPRSRWLTGPGSTPVMAAFTHLNPEGSRFSAGNFGVFYASRELDTAIRETVYHRERFMSRTMEPPLQLQMRCYRTSINASLHDICGGYPQLHDPDDYSASRKLGSELRMAGANGIVYDSVRNPGGHCAALFWPDCVAPCVQAKHLAYLWDGRHIAGVIEMTAVKLPAS